MSDTIPPAAEEKMPKPWESIGLVAVQMTILLGFGVVFGVLNGFLQLGQNWVLLLTFLGEILLLFPLFIWIAARGYPWQKTFQWYPASLKMIALAAGLGIVAWPLASAMALPFEWALSNIGPAPELPAPETMLQTVLWAVTVMVAAPLVEEPMFRGFVLRGWLPLGRGVAIVASGVLFGLLHGQLAQLVALSLVGMLLAVVALRAGSIIPAMVLHGVFNAISFFTLMNPAWAESIPDSTLLLAAVGALPVFIVLMMLLLREKGAALPEKHLPTETGWVLIAVGSFGVMGLFGVFAVMDVLNRVLAPMAGGF